MSASDSLSQSDIDALFSGGGGAAEEPEAQPTGPEAQVYDFRRPSRISKERLGSLKAIYGLVTKGLEGWFAGRIREQISIELESLDPLTHGEFLLALPSPCSSYLVALGDEGMGTAVIEMGQDFSFFVVDRFQSGEGELEIPDRSLTLVERALVQLVVDRICHQLKDAWREHMGLEPRIIGFESVPEMIQVANPEDPVLVAHIKVWAGDLSSLLLICLPFPVIEKFFSDGAGRRMTHSRGSSEERAVEQSWMSEHLAKAALTVEARLPTFGVSLGALAELKEGDVLSTGCAPDAELVVRVAGKPRWMATGGREGQNRALRITRELGPGS